ncbi:2-dehydropantoate 2-reductase PAN5 [Sporobolomyces koalae]|uniref:2-dehydropantoate 2-reductase PAN5 n=1 Tax=Sporobolomyces koalae TaxID=500713 RepID=UPI0031735D38
MRFHLLGAGSIGSLFATHLSSLDSTQVRLILRRKDLAAQLLNVTPDRAQHPYGTIKLERNGLVRKTTTLEMELTRNPAEMYTARSSTSRDSKTSKIDPSVWLRNDPIDTLIVTTKAPQTLPALRHILPRLSSRSTIVLCQNGMGTLEGLLDTYWPEDRSDEIERERAASFGPSSDERWRVGAGGRPSFICATTTHGAWRKAGGHFVHAGMGELKFGLLPNRAILSAISNVAEPSWLTPSENPIVNPRSLVDPTLAHLPSTPVTDNLRTTLSSLLACTDLQPTWLPLPTLQITQLQKLAVNASVNSLTALMGVNNGALVGSPRAKSLIETVTHECAQVFAAHIAREEGRWEPVINESEIASSPPALPDHHPLSSKSLLAHTLKVVFKTASNISSTLSDLLPLHQTSHFTLDNAPSLPSRTEIEYINGYVTALGKRYSIDTPVVKALGELVLLKEEMGRVGAIDQVWKGRKDKVLASERPSSSRTRSSIFNSPEPSALSTSSEPETTTSTRIKVPKPNKAHARAHKYSQIDRELREGARTREVERIQRAKGHDQGG